MPGIFFKQDKIEAIKWFRLAADKGVVLAQNMLGECHLFGDGVEKNHSEAIKWFSLAANKNDFTSQYYLGLYYYQGIHIKQDYALAFKLFKLSADQECPFPQADLVVGQAYRAGEGVKRDAIKGFEYVRKAALQGYTDAEIDLAVLYYNGEGVTKNREEALRWLRKAESKGRDITRYLNVINHNWRLENTQQCYACNGSGLKRLTAQGHTSTCTTCGGKGKLFPR